MGCSSRTFILGIIIALVAISVLPVCARFSDVPVSPIDGMVFEPMSSDPSLAVARDTQGQTWIRGTIPERLLGETVVLQVPSARIYDYRLYLPKDGTLTLMPRNIDEGTVNSRSRFPQYEFIAEDTVYYLDVGAHAPQVMEVQLEEYHVLSHVESSQLLRIGLYYGLALMSLTFNLVFYLIFKDKRFITYCALLFTTFLSFLYEDGMFYYASDGRWTMDYLTVLNSALTSIIAVPFTYYFLDLNAAFRRFRKAYVMVSALMLAGVGAYVWNGSPIVYAVVYTLCFLFPAGCLYVAIIRFKQDVYARFLVLSLGLVTVVGLLYLLNTRIDSTLFSLFGISTFRLVSALEIISISFAIVFKVRALQHENDRYREELNNYLKTLEIKGVEKRHRENGLIHAKAQVETKKTMMGALKAHYELTDREIEVLLCIWDGLTNKEIAEELFVTLSTTKYHVSNLYLKLDVKNRNQVQVLQKSLWR